MKKASVAAGKSSSLAAFETAKSRVIGMAGGEEGREDA